MAAMSIVSCVSWDHVKAKYFSRIKIPEWSSSLKDIYIKQSIETIERLKTCLLF